MTRTSEVSLWLDQVSGKIFLQAMIATKITLRNKAQTFLRHGNVGTLFWKKGSSNTIRIKKNILHRNHARELLTFSKYGYNQNSSQNPKKLILR